MSDQAQPTSASAGLAEIGDAVENAVAGNQEQTTEETQSTEENAGAEGTTEGAATAAEAKATIKDPKASKTEKKEAKKILKKLKLKVDGQEIEEEFDPENEDYLREQLQLAKVARKRMQEKALIEKDVLKFLDDIKKDPFKALSDPAIGLDIKNFAAKVIEREIENSKKTPEQLKAEKLEEELRELKAARQKEKEESDKSERERLTEQEFERYDMLMTQALEKHSFPKNPAVIKRMAEYLLIGLNAKKDVTPEDVVPLIREDLKNDYRDILNSMPDDDALEDFIGKEYIDRIRKAKLKNAKKAASNPAVKAPAKASSTGQKTETNKDPEKKQTFRDFFKV